MTCQIIYELDKRGKPTTVVKKVLASNNKESNLYNELLTDLKSQEQALKLWSFAYTPIFKDNVLDNSVDKNNEPYASNVKTVYNQLTSTSEDIDEEELGLYREDVKYKRITVRNKKAFQDILDKYNIEQVRSHFYYVLTKEQQKGVDGWLKLAAKNKDTSKRELGSTKKGYELESREKQTQNWEKGEVTVKIIKGKTYLAIEDHEEVIEEDTDGYKWFRYPVKDFYLIPIDVINEVEKPYYIKASFDNVTYVPRVQKEINAFLFKTKNVSAKKSANFYLLQMKSLIKNAFAEIHDKDISYDEFRNMSTESVKKLYKELEIDKQVDHVIKSFENYINGLDKNEIIKELMDLYSEHLTEDTDLKDFENLLNFLPEKFIKLITFRYINTASAYFTNSSSMNNALNPFGELKNLLDYNRREGFQRALAINVALRNMKNDGLITDKQVDELNKTIKPAIQAYLETKKNNPNASQEQLDTVRRQLIKKIKTIRDAGLDNFDEYWQKATDEIQKETFVQNKGLSLLTSYIANDIKSIDGIFTELTLGNFDGVDLPFRYDKVTVTLHELGHALDRYLYSTNQKDRNKIVSFINKLIDRNEFGEYLMDGLFSRGYRTHNERELTADLFAYLVGKAINKDFGNSHLVEMDNFFKNNEELITNIYKEVFGAKEGGIFSFIRDLLNSLIKAANKVIGKDYFKEVTSLTKNIPSYFQGKTTIDDVMSNMTSIITNDENFNIQSLLNSDVNGKSFLVNQEDNIYNDNSIRYDLKAVDILQSEKAIKAFENIERRKITGDEFWKNLQNLGIPKDQLEMLKQYNTYDRQSLIDNMSRDYAFALDKQDIPSDGSTTFNIPGVTNFQIQDITTRNIIPSVNSHLKGTNNNSIGWFKSDTASDNTRRILEIQSDLFQKGRKSEALVNKEINNVAANILDNVNKGIIPDDFSIETDFDGLLDKPVVIFRTGDKTFSMHPVDSYETKLQSVIAGKSKTAQGIEILNLNQSVTDKVLSDYKKFIEEFVKQNPSKDDYAKENQFLSLMSKDWSTFFVKSVIQDTLDKGFELMLFPNGNTAAKIENHLTPEQFKKSKVDSLKDLKKQMSKINLRENPERTDEWEKLYQQYELFSAELETFERSNVYKNSGIYNFYEETIFNILKKQNLNPTLIVDKYGNTWYQVDLKNASDKILLSKEASATKKLEMQLGIRNNKGHVVTYPLSKYEAAVKNSVEVNNVLKTQRPEYSSRVVKFEDSVTKKSYYKLSLEVSPEEYNKQVGIISNTLFNNGTTMMSNDLLNQIIRTSDVSENIKSLSANLFKNAWNDVAVELLTIDQLKTKFNSKINKNTSGYYDGKNNKIYIVVNDNLVGKSKQEVLNRVANTILHEVIHALTANNLTDTYKRFYAQAKSKIQASAQYKALSEEEKRSVDYALSNPDEFITGTFTSGTLMTLMRQIEPVRPKEEIKNLWQEFVNMVKSILGLNTSSISLLDDAMSIGAETIESISNNEFKNREMYEQYDDSAFFPASSKDFVLGDDTYNGTDTDSLTTIQKQILARFNEHHVLFEDEFGESLGVQMVSISKEVIPRLEAQIQDKKELKKKIEYWKQLALSGDETELYKIRRANGDIDYVLNRVSHAQTAEFNYKNAKRSVKTRDMSTAQMLNESDLSVIQRNLGTFSHKVMENLLDSFSIERPMVAFDESTNTMESMESFLKNYDYLKFRTATPELEDFYTAIIDKKEERIRLVDVKVLEQTALKIYYEMYKTQFLINQKAKELDPKGYKAGDFVFFTEVRSYNKEVDMAGTQDVMVVYSNGYIGTFDYKFNNIDMIYGTPLLTAAEQKAILERQGVDTSRMKEKYLMMKKPKVYVNDAQSALMKKKSKMISYDAQQSTYAYNNVAVYGAKGILQSTIVPVNMQIAAVKQKNRKTIFLEKIAFLGTDESFRSLDGKTQALVPLAMSKQSTIDDNLNKLVERLKIEVEKQEDLRGSHATVGNETIDKLKDSINILRTKLTADHLIDSATILYEEIDLKFAELLKQKVRDSFDFEEGETAETKLTILTMPDVLQYMDLLESFSAISTSLDFAKKALAAEVGETNPEYLKMQSQLSILQTKNNEFMQKLKDRRTELMLAFLKEKDVFVDRQMFENNRIESKDISRAGMLFDKATEINMVTVKAIKKIIDEDVNLLDRKDIVQNAEKMEKLLVEYEKWAKAKGLSGTRMFDILISEVNRNDVSKIQLIRELDYTKWDLKILELQEEYHADKSKGPEIMKWFRDNTEMDSMKYLKDRVDYSKKLKAAGYTDETVELKLAEFDSYRNVMMNNGDNTVWFKPNIQYHIKPKPGKRSEFLNEKFKELEKDENKPAMNMLLHFYEMNSTIRELLGYKGRTVYDTTIPSVYAGFNEDLDRQGILKMKYRDVMSKAIAANLIKQDDDEMYGASRQDGNNGMVLDEYNRRLSIPILFMQDIQNGAKNTSRDLPKSFLLMMNQAHHYSRIKENEDMMIAFRQHLTESKIISTDSKGKVITINDVVQMDKDAKDSNWLLYVDNMLKREAYGINEFTKDTEITIGNTTISGQKALGKVSGLVSLGVLGLNVASAIGGYASTRQQLQAEAAKGEHFNKIALERVFSAFEKHDTKQILAELFFEIAQDNRANENIAKLSTVSLNRKLAKMFGDSPVMILQRVTDNRLENDIMSAMLKYYGVGPKGEVQPLWKLKMKYPESAGYDHSTWLSIYDGMSHPETFDYKKIKESTVTNPYELLSFKNILGVDIKNDSESNALNKMTVLFRNKARAVIGNVKGNQAYDDKSMYQNYVIGRELMKFRGWIPAMFKERFAGTAYNATTEEIKTGRYRVLVGEVLNGGVQKSAKNVLQLITEIASFGMYKGFSKDSKLAEHYYEAWKVQNPGDYKEWLKEWGYDVNDLTADNREAVEKMAFERYKQSRIEALKANVKEFQMYAGLAMILLLLSGLMGGKVDKDDPWWAFKTFKLLERANQESGYFFNPAEMMKVTSRGPAPTLTILSTIYNFIGNTASEMFDVTSMAESNKTRNILPKADPNSSWGVSWLTETKDNTPRFYYTAKLVPGLAGATKYFDVFGKEEEGGFVSWVLGTGAGGTGDR